MRFTFVVEVPVPFAITVEAESLEDAVVLARSRTDTQLMAERQVDPPDVWCTSKEFVLNDTNPSDGTLVDFHQGTGNEDFAYIEQLWERAL